MEKRTSLTANGLLWFGAAISIAEMLSGTYFAPLGWKKGLAAILIGHVLGGSLMYFSGLIGGKSRKNAMATVQLSFGTKGANIFAGLNVLQLVGWTAVMLITAAQACQLFLPLSKSFWVIVIGAVTALWVLIGLKNLTKLNGLAMVILLAAGIYLSILLVTKNAVVVSDQSISFGMALELAIAMPLSWLPLISDYTSGAKSPKKATLVSVLVYNLISSWMYGIGLFGVLATGQTEIAAMMKNVGFGVLALVVIVFSTVTTTFLDVYSAGVSSQSFLKKINVKYLSMAVCLLGCLIGIRVPLSSYENFLYLISSVFVPMIAIQIVDFFVFHKRTVSKNWDTANICLWLAGVVVYQFFLKIETPIGSTIPVVLLVSAASAGLNYLRSEKNAHRVS